MKNPMRIVALVFLCLAPILLAFEKPLGAIQSPDGGSYNNWSPIYHPALYADGGAYTDGGVWNDAGFTLPYGIKLSSQCTLASCIRACATGVNCVATCTHGSANTGPQIGASMLFDVPTDSSINSIAMIPVVPNPDGGSVTCQVFQVLP